MPSKVASVAQRLLQSDILLKRWGSRSLTCLIQSKCMLQRPPWFGTLQHEIEEELCALFRSITDLGEFDACEERLILGQSVSPKEPRE
jgi:hypothetical protein